MMDDRTRRALIGRYLAEPDVLAWRAWADACEEAGDDRQAALWRFRAEHFGAVERETLRLLRGFSGRLRQTLLEVHTPHVRVALIAHLTRCGFAAVLERADADYLVEVLRTRVEWSSAEWCHAVASHQPDPQLRHLRKRLIGLIDAAFAEVNRP